MTRTLQILLIAFAMTASSVATYCVHPDGRHVEIIGCCHSHGDQSGHHFGDDDGIAVELHESDTFHVSGKTELSVHPGRNQLQILKPSQSGQAGDCDSHADFELRAAGEPGCNPPDPPLLLLPLLRI